jgi:trans-aconitate methyltransferase
VVDVEVDNWDRHWQDFTPSAEMGPAHEYRRRTVLRLLNVQSVDEPVSFLEIGSGIGEFAEVFLKRYPRTEFLGVELSGVAVEISKQRVPSARFVQRNLLLPPPDDERIHRANFAACVEVLEHLDDPVLLLRNAAAYMAPGCKLLVTVPGGPMSAFDRHIGHRKHYKPSELKDLLQSAGFTIEAVYGAGFPFFNLYRSAIILRGKNLRSDISGSPSLLVRIGTVLFGAAFRFNLMCWGWQTIAVGRYRGGK